MATKFKVVDRITPMLLPPNLQDWLPNDHMVHFIVDAVTMLDLRDIQVNERGTGSAQYPPSMMLALLIYCYATGRFSSRGIEQATHFDIAVRYICGGEHHPDHSVICAFRTANSALFSECFVKVLMLAREMGELKSIGTVSVDGTKIKADASKHAAVSYKKAGEIIAELELEVGELMQKADKADQTPLDDGLTLPDEISRRKERIAKLKGARQVIEDRYESTRQEKTAEYEQKMDARNKRKENGGKVMGPDPKPPSNTPEDKAQMNFTDPDSRIMKQGNGQHFEQSYNAQAAVETDSYLIVGEQVSVATNDRHELSPTLASIPEELGSPDDVLADAGYYGEKALSEIESDGTTTTYVPPKRNGHRVRIRDIEKVPDPMPPPEDAPFVDKMRHRLSTKAGKAKYALRKQTVEPVFGIIKEVLGFRQFSLRGHPKVQIEWTLLCLSYNMKRLHKLTCSSLVPSKPEFAIS